MRFNELDIIDPILSALQKQGYTTPTPIQQQSIPPALQGRDILGCAQTGTGKTAAFAIPVLQLMHQKYGMHKGNRPIRALILTPTRELAIQIEESLHDYGKNLGLRHLVIFGGVGQTPQTDALKRGVDILVATPGRLLDLMNQKFISLQQIEFFVLDEADLMLDLGFNKDIQDLIRKIPVADNVIEYAVKLVNKTRLNSEYTAEVTKKYLQWGAGPRASQYLIIGAKAHAAINGKYSPDIEDVKAIATPILRHRIVLNYKAEAEGVSVEDIIKQLL